MRVRITYTLYWSPEYSEEEHSSIETIDGWDELPDLIRDLENPFLAEDKMVSRSITKIEVVPFYSQD